MDSTPRTPEEGWVHENVAKTFVPFAESARGEGCESKQHGPVRCGGGFTCLRVQSVRVIDRSFDRRGYVYVSSSSFVVIGTCRMRINRRFVFCARRRAPIATGPRGRATMDGRTDAGQKCVLQASRETAADGPVPTRSTARWRVDVLLQVVHCLFCTQTFINPFTEDEDDDADADDEQKCSCSSISKISKGS